MKMSGLRRLFSGSPKAVCDACGASVVSYRCTRCSKKYCDGCIHTFGEKAARALMERVYGNRGGLTFGAVKIFDDQGRAFCPYCYGNLLDRARRTGQWVVKSEDEMDPSCVAIGSRSH